jgi:hypothetical protein
MMQLRLTNDAVFNTSIRPQKIVPIMFRVLTISRLGCFSVLQGRRNLVYGRSRGEKSPRDKSKSKMGVKYPETVSKWVAFRVSSYEV